MNVWKILTITFVTLLDLSKLHKVEKEFLELLEEINNQIQTKTVTGAGEVLVEQQSGLKSQPNSPPFINRFKTNRSKANSNCKVEASVLQQDLFSLIGNVLHTIFPNMVGDSSKNELARFTLNKRHQIQSEKKIVLTAEMSTKSLVSGGKNLKLFLGQDFFKEMIIVNRIKNLHNLWFLSDLNFDQMITYIKLIISILNNKGMFINSEFKKITFCLPVVLLKQIFSFIHL